MGCNCNNKNVPISNKYMDLFPSFENNSNTRSNNLKKVVYKTPDNKIIKSVFIPPKMLKGFHTMNR